MTGGVTPLVYYLGLIGDCCVAIYCFCSGYALDIINQKKASAKEYYAGRLKSLLKLLINYWLILFIFSAIGLLVHDKYIPGSLKAFVLNFFLISKYNSAWWFLTTYVFLILLSRPIYLFTQKVHPVAVCVISFIIYFVAYVQRFKNVIALDNNVLNWIITQLALLGTSLMPFVWGMLFYKYKVFTKIKSFVSAKFTNGRFALISFAIFAAMFVAHGIVETVFVAPFTGIVIIVLFNVVKKGKAVDKIFLFLGEHSTNIWLTHMFFYSVLFVNFVFKAKYPLFIFVFMLMLTVACSYIINLIYKPLVKLIK